jgi:molybdate transport system substrate-binding protein
MPDLVMRAARRAALGLLLAASALLSTPARAQEPLLVFAAASLKNALDEINAAFRAARGVEVRTSYGASPALARQIEQGAPADLFVSADLDWMDYLDTRQLVRAGTRVNLLGNRIVLVAPKDTRLGEVDLAPGVDIARLLAGGRLAMAQVETVPAGKYGKAALEALGAWAGVADRLAQTENVRAALLLVSRGEAPLGIVYRTDAAADPAVKVLGTFPDTTHPPIVYPAALTATSRSAAAGDYLAYLRSPAARAVFEGQGFAVLAAPSA